MIKISPSLLAADFSKIENEIVSVNNADYLHVDVMDGVFVGNTTVFFDIDAVKLIKRHSNIPFISHLMVANPLQYVKAYADAGSDVISFHIEAAENQGSNYVNDVIKEIRKYNCRPSIAINPDTSIRAVLPYLSSIKHLIVMSVVPGKSGQKYIDNITRKIAELRRIAVDNHYSLEIEVDGGIKLENCYKAINAGADILVSGTGIFKQKDRKGVIEKMKDVILIGSDHAGYKLKEHLKKYFDKNRIAYQDIGTYSEQSVDYPIYAQKIASQVSQGKARRGILVCGTGQGMAIAANKYSHVRAALCSNVLYAQQAREHGDSNILCLGGRVTKPKASEKIVDAWLNTGFSKNERHKRRVEMIERM